MSDSLYKGIRLSVSQIQVLRDMAAGWRLYERPKNNKKPFGIFYLKKDKENYTVKEATIRILQKLNVIERKQAGTGKGREWILRI